MELYLIRHGHTPSMELGLYLGVTDEGLSPRGTAQIEMLRQSLSGVTLHDIYCSPLLRTRESAALFCADRDHEIRIHDALSERNFGVFERSRYEELLRTYPDLISAWNADPWNYIPPNGESAAAFHQRVVSFYRDTLLPVIPPSHAVAIFTHQGVIRTLLAEAMQFDREQIWRFAIAPGHVVKLEIDTEGYAFVHW